MKETKIYIPQCNFCGARVGEISEETGKIITVIYDCPKCRMNYCNECSYEKEINGEMVQLCLRCDSKLDKLS